MSLLSPGLGFENEAWKNVILGFLELGVNIPSSAWEMGGQVA